MKLLARHQAYSNTMGPKTVFLSIYVSSLLMKLGFSENMAPCVVVVLFLWLSHHHSVHPKDLSKRALFLSDIPALPVQSPIRSIDGVLLHGEQLDMLKLPGVEHLPYL